MIFNLCKQNLNNLFIFIFIIILTVKIKAQTFLTLSDFLGAFKEENVTFLTELDYNNADKFGILISKKTYGKRNILTTQKYFRGDIRGKASWKKKRLKLNSDSLLNNKHVRYNGVTNHIKKWPNGRIPYVLSTNYTEHERAILARAFQQYHFRTCIRFTPRTLSDKDYLYIGKIDGCYSDVGRAGGRQELSLDNGCLHLDTILHELMHSVGFYHEHERWDRDRFVTILWPNIDKGAYDQFGRVDLIESSYYGEPYDYYSIMHYDSMAFSKNGLETLIAKAADVTKLLGSATDFSSTDLIKIHKMYKCFPNLNEKNENLSSYSAFTGKHNTINNLNNKLFDPAGAVESINVLPTTKSPDAFASTQQNPWSLMRPAHTLSTQKPIFPIESNPLHFTNTFLFNNIGGSDFKRKIMNDDSNALLQRPTTIFKISKQNQETKQCTDKVTICWQWINRCNSQFFKTVMKNFCPRTCGLCSNYSNKLNDIKKTVKPLTNSQNPLFDLHSFVPLNQNIHTYPVIINPLNE